MRENFLAPATTLASGFGYEAFAGLNAMTHGNGVTLDLAYDLDGRLAALDAYNGATPVLDLDYAYDLASNIAAIADAGGGPRGQVFQYDALHRLTAASGTYNAGFAGPPPGIGNKPADRGPAQFPGQARAPIARGDITYSYDSVGNRTARLMDLGGATTAETYGYDAFSNRLLSVAGEGGRPSRATTRAISYGDSGNAEADLSRPPARTLSQFRLKPCRGKRRSAARIACVRYDRAAARGWRGRFCPIQWRHGCLATRH